MKTAIHQSMIGKQLIEDPNRTAYDERSTLKYWGFGNAAVTIIAVWLDAGSVKVMARDEAGHLAELYPTLFLLRDPERTSPDPRIDAKPRITTETYKKP